MEISALCRESSRWKGLRSFCVLEGCPCARWWEGDRSSQVWLVAEDHDALGLRGGERGESRDLGNPIKFEIILPKSMFKIS
jgi:hypothetical protein